MSENSDRKSALAPFRLSTFRGLWGANVLSNIGGYINDVGAAWLMTSLSTSPIMVSLVQVAANAPFFLLAIPSGALGDIVNRRKLLLATQVAMMLLSALLGVLVLFQLISPITLLALLFTIEVFDALAGPSWQTVIPEIVGVEDMSAAITLNSAGINVARSLGPALGGALLVVTATAGPAFLINAVSFVGVIAFLWRWKRRVEKSTVPAERLFGAMRIGVRYIRYAPRFRATLMRVAAYLFFGSAIATLLPIIARSHLHGGPGTYGVLLGFMGAGAVSAVPIIRQASRAMKVDVLLAIATAITGLVEFALGGAHHFPFLCGVMFVAGIAWITVLSSLNNAAQSVLPTWVRARAMSVYLMAFFGALTAGSIVWGVIATRSGAPVAMTIAACGMFATLALIPRFRLVDQETLDLAPSIDWPSPLVARGPPDDRGPVLITVEYRVDPKHAEQFLIAIQRLRLQRMRTGAFQWGLFDDTADATRFVEVFYSDTWAEHRRQHSRATMADREIADAVAALHIGPEKPTVRHLIHTDVI